MGSDTLDVQKERSQDDMLEEQKAITRKAEELKARFEADRRQG